MLLFKNPEEWNRSKRRKQRGLHSSLPSRPSVQNHGRMEQKEAKAARGFPFFAPFACFCSKTRGIGTEASKGSKGASILRSLRALLFKTRGIGTEASKGSKGSSILRALRVLLFKNPEEWNRSKRRKQRSLRTSRRSVQNPEETRRLPTFGSRFGFLSERRKGKCLPCKHLFQDLKTASVPPIWAGPLATGSARRLKDSNGSRFLP